MNDFKLELENTSAKFIQEIENFAQEKNCDLMEAVIEYCKLNNIEVETAASIIKSFPKIKARLRNEGESLNLLKKIKRISEE